MLFTSLEFVFFFLPIVLIIHFILPRNLRNYWLSIVSILFYAWGGPRLGILLAASIICNFVFGWRVAELKAEGRAIYCKLYLAGAIAANLIPLFIFKYMNFATDSLLSAFPGMESLITRTEFVLPIGISFFTFQAISYLVDVYRGLPAQKNIGKLALYIALFPQLIAGPIVRYNTIAEEIEHREITAKSFSDGVLRFIVGFNKKVLLANQLAIVSDAAWGSAERTVVFSWLGAVCYALQIYYDFSGYSDMAIGLGKMFGFSFLENFSNPYISKTVSEFWRRWHMSLGSWFRDYVYIPLGGSRVESKWRLFINIGIVWMLTGIWHGAEWTFLIWGLLYGTFIYLEKILSIDRRIEKNRAIGAAYRVFIIFCIILLWVLFRSDNLPAAIDYFRSMIGMNNNYFVSSESMFYLKEYRAVLIFGCLFAIPLKDMIFNSLSRRSKAWGGVLHVCMDVVQLMLFVISISYLVMNAHNPFIYFNF